jgi:hypothetical protein
MTLPKIVVTATGPLRQLIISSLSKLDVKIETADTSTTHGQTMRLVSNPDLPIKIGSSIDLKNRKAQWKLETKLRYSR